MKHLFLALLLLAMISLLAACGGSDDAEGDKPAAQAESAQAAEPAGEVPAVAATVSTTCSKCHGLDKVCGKIGSLDKTGWAVVISKMVTKGAKLNREQALGAAEFLAKPALAKPALCN